MYNARRMMEEARIQLLKHKGVEAKLKPPPLKPMMRTVMRRPELLALYQQGGKLRDARVTEEQNFEAGHDLAMEALLQLPPCLVVHGLRLHAGSQRVEHPLHVFGITPASF